MTLFLKNNRYFQLRFFAGMLEHYSEYYGNKEKGEEK